MAGRRGQASGSVRGFQIQAAKDQEEHEEESFSIMRSIENFVIWDKAILVIHISKAKTQVGYE